MTTLLINPLFGMLLNLMGLIEQPQQPMNKPPQEIPAERPDGQSIIKNAIENVLGGKPKRNFQNPIEEGVVKPNVGALPAVVIDFVGDLSDGSTSNVFGDKTLGKLTPVSSLITNEEFERLLDQADKLVAAGRSDLAPVLWQKVLDEGTAVLVPQRSGLKETARHVYQSYRPLVEEVEARIAASGSAGLQAYQLQANGAARLLLGHVAPDDIEPAQLEVRERVLRDVVKRYFLSASGDNSAFELACRMLERGNYVQAAELLRKLARHPEIDVSESDIVARLIIALARGGANLAADDLLANKGKLLAPSVRLMVKADLDRLRGARATVLTPMSLPSDPFARVGSFNAALLWVYQPAFWLKKPPPRQQNNRGVTIAIRNGQQVLMEIDPNGKMKELQADVANWPEMTRQELASSWSNKNWTPAGNALLVGSRLFVKSQERLVCCDLESGQVQWMGRKSKFPLDQRSEQSQIYEMIGWRVAANAPQRPRGVVEAQLFGDRLAHALAAYDDLVVSIEADRDVPSQTPNTAADGNVAFLGGVNAAANGPWRINSLAAYDARTGKLRWHRGLSDNGLTDSGAVSVPLATKLGLVVAAIVNKKLEIVLLDPMTGSTRWRSVLLDGIPPDFEVWAPLGLENDGDSLFVSTGYGAVFSLQLTTGQVEWASAYPRKKTEADLNMQAMMGHGGAISLVAANLAAPQANFIRSGNGIVIAMGADSDHLMAVDRHTGTLCWEAPLAPNNQQPCRDVLGVIHDLLIVSGPNVVRAYSMARGRLQWESLLSSITGRGLVTEDAIYIPHSESITRLHPKTGKEVNRIKVPMIDGLPVGNLTTDGQRLVVTGPGVVLALTPVAAKAEETSK